MAINGNTITIKSDDTSLVINFDKDGPVIDFAASKGFNSNTDISDIVKSNLDEIRADLRTAVSERLKTLDRDPEDSLTAQDITNVKNEIGGNIYDGNLVFEKNQTLIAALAHEALYQEVSGIKTENNSGGTAYQPLASIAVEINQRTGIAHQPLRQTSRNESAFAAEGNMFKDEKDMVFLTLVPGYQDSMTILGNYGIQHLPITYQPALPLQTIITPDDDNIFTVTGNNTQKYLAANKAEIMERLRSLIHEKAQDEQGQLSEDKLDEIERVLEARIRGEHESLFGFMKDDDVITISGFALELVVEARDSLENGWNFAKGEKPADEAPEKVAEAPAEKPAEDAPAEKAAEAPAEKPADEAPAEKPPVKAAEAPAETKLPAWLRDGYRGEEIGDLQRAFGQNDEYRARLSEGIARHDDNIVGYRTRGVSLDYMKEHGLDPNTMTIAALTQHVRANIGQPHQTMAANTEPAGLDGTEPANKEFNKQAKNTADPDAPEGTDAKVAENDGPENDGADADDGVTKPHNSAVLDTGSPTGMG